MLKVESSSTSNTKTSKQKSRVKWKNGNQKTHRNDCEQSRDGTKSKREGKTTSSLMHTAPQENQRSDRGTSEGGGRDKL